MRSSAGGRVLRGSVPSTAGVFWTGCLWLPGAGTERLEPKPYQQANSISPFRISGSPNSRGGAQGVRRWDGAPEASGHELRVDPSVDRRIEPLWRLLGHSGNGARTNPAGAAAETDHLSVSAA